MRLVGGTSNLEGRVEICLNDEWGTVCDQMWNFNDSSVVCRQLGLAFNGMRCFKKTFSGDFYTFFIVDKESEVSISQGTGRIWLDNVQCAGNEGALMNCAANSSGNHSCTHSQDVGVKCVIGKFQSWVNRVQ